MDQKITFTQWH